MLCISIGKMLLPRKLEDTGLPHEQGTCRGMVYRRSLSMGESHPLDAASKHGGVEMIDNALNVQQQPAEEG